ncbi:hypothetical protein OpiT1DRAFT_00760 [Opitutaceae bacterium TAV1]|nr:hypothetical protein OpiT1DRAFT_00760 [Opitutaceae bacterium TAV1]
MNKPSSRLFCLLSLAANIGLAGCLIFLLANRESASGQPPSTTQRQTLPPSAPLAWPELSAGSLAALRAHDLAALREALTLAGFPAQVIRRQITRQIRDDYNARIAAIAPFDPEAWWQYPPWQPERYLSGAQREQARRLRKEMREQIARALGPLGEEPNLFQKSALAALPAEKRQAVANLEADYRDMLREIEDNMNDFPLPDDAEQRATLQAERQRELAALLSLEELRDYEQASTSIAMFIHAGAARIGATREEFNRIHELSRLYYEEALTPGRNMGDPGIEKAHKQMRDGLRELLGDERYRLFAREQNYDYQAVSKLSARLQLPSDTADRVYDLRGRLADSCAQIDQNAALNREQKGAALARAADEIRSHAKTILGDEAGQAWLNSDGSWWIGAVAKGGILTCDPVTGDVDDVKHKYR